MGIFSIIPANISTSGRSGSVVSADITPPGIVSMIATGATNIRVIFNEATTDNQSAGSLTFRKNGTANNPTVRTVVDSSTIDYTVPTMSGSNTIDASYSSGAAHIKDTAGNELASFTNTSVTNSIGGSGMASPTHFEWLGDSITRGELASNLFTEGYHALVSGYYGASSVNHAYPGAVVKPGWGGIPENGGSLQIQYPGVQTGNYGPGNYLFTAFGTNDFVSSAPDATWKSNYKITLQAIIAFGWNPAQIIISTAPYQSARPNMPAGIVLMQEIATELGTQFFSLYAYTQANGGDSILQDGIHPTTAGHLVCKNGIVAFINSLL